MDGFDIGIGVMEAWRDEGVMGGRLLFDGMPEAGSAFDRSATVELKPIVRLDEYLRQVDAVLFEMLQEPLDDQGGVSHGDLVCKSQELSSDRKFPDGVLEPG